MYSAYSRVFTRVTLLERVLAMTLCLSVCHNFTSRCSVETAERIALVFAWELPSTYPTLCCKEIQELCSKLQTLEQSSSGKYHYTITTCNSISTVQAFYQLSVVVGF